MTPQLLCKADAVRFFVPEEHRALVTLPWDAPLEEWHEERVRLIPVKSGLSRHVVRFLEVEGVRYAVKETTASHAFREHERYEELRRKAIPTLLPVGVVTRDDGVAMVGTMVGAQVQERETGYLITRLMEKVVPDSYLFRREFTRENRTHIWDAVVRLFVRLHAEGVYWGDASLANMLINLETEIVPGLGRRRTLQAVLADAETVEIHPSISATMRAADVEFFLESMLWTDADLRSSGVVRDPISTQEDQDYLRASYRERYALEQEMRAFEVITHIDVDTLLGEFTGRGYARLILKHIQEHKWYLSERKGGEVPLVEAAEDWYRNVFKPVCRVFSEQGLLAFFPDTTASSLYVQIMEHKYYMSEHQKRDVGLLAALEDYVERFSRYSRFEVTVRSIVQSLTTLFHADAFAGRHVILS